MGRLVLGREYFRFPNMETYVTDPLDESRSASALDDVLPGGLLLVRTPGLLYSLGRKLTRNIYDHIAS